MIVFIDESGDVGFRIQRGSTPVFVVALVIFDDELDAEITAVEIKKYRKEIGKTEKFEFKFNKCKGEYRKGFLSAVKKCTFRVRAIVFQKDLVYSPTLRQSKDKFYSYAVKMVLQHNGDTIRNAKIRLDGLGERVFKREMTTYLRKNLNNEERKVMENFKFVDSKENVLIQLADMVAGALHRSYESHKHDCMDYQRIIHSRIENVWEFE